MGRIGLPQHFDRVEQYCGIELRNDRREEASASRSHVEFFSAERDKVVGHIEEIAWVGQLGRILLTRKPFLEMFEVISKIVPCFEVTIISITDKAGSAKPRMLLDESGELRDTRPADEVEVRVRE